MGFLAKLAVKVIINGAALYAAKTYFPDSFILTGGLETLALGALVITFLNVIVRPIIKLLTFPLVWLSFGLFNFVIHMALLWAADQLLTQLTITKLSTLFFVSVGIAFANAFF